MVALVQIPEIIEASQYAKIAEKCSKFIVDEDARIAIDRFGGSTEYKKLNKDEYFIDEVHKQDWKYILNDGTEVAECDVYERPITEVVALKKNFGLVDIEQFARVAEGLTFTLVEVY